MLGFYYILLRLGYVSALVSQNEFALNLAVIGAAMLLPALCIPWLLWTVREIKKPTPEACNQSELADLTTEHARWVKKLSLNKELS